MIHLMPPSSIQILVSVILLVAFALALLKSQRYQALRGFRLLPGPVPLPLVGNLLSIDTKKPWVTYTEWATRHGDIFKIRVLKQDIIVVNSKKIVQDLLDKRSAIYSDRPLLATRDPFGWSFNFAWTPYGEYWRSQRRIFHQSFRAEGSLAFYPIQLRKTRKLLLDIISTPHDFTEHIKGQVFSAAIIMSIVYDYETAPEHDYFVELFELGHTLALENLTPEISSIVEAFPFVLHLPEWCPGSALGRKAVISKRCAVRMIGEPFEYAKKREAMGSHAPAMALDLLRDNKYSHEDPLHLQLLAETCASAFVAGGETTSATLLCFMLAILQHQDVQQRAQEEIDSVVGKDRLPAFDDRPNLPYVEAVLLETLRMYPIVPLGVPHSTTADDIYEDIFIPKGSTVVANIWSIYRNKDAFPEPDVFRPERFFVDGKLKGVKTTDSLAYGFGRRICPGRYVADSSVWIAMVSILYAFKITKAVDEQGKEIEFKPTFTTGVTMAPHSFPCSITPRLSNIDIRKLATLELSET